MWLAGHSQGGITSNRIICTDYFKGKVDGWLSLSGGRIGQAPLDPRFGPPKADGSPPDPRPAGGPGMGSGALPTCEFSHIYETGQWEITSLPDSSPWAAKYLRARCGEGHRRRQGQPRLGYARAGYKVWGMKARPGSPTSTSIPSARAAASSPTWCGGQGPPRAWAARHRGAGEDDRRAPAGRRRSQRQGRRARRQHPAGARRSSLPASSASRSGALLAPLVSPGR